MTAYFYYDDAAFRASFQEFANTTTYPEATLSNFFTMAGSYVANENYGVLNGDNRFLALNLMTAHLTKLNSLILAGQTPSIVGASSIDKIAVTLVPPPLKNQFHWWLSTTPYGAQLLALLGAHSAGGFGVGGSFTRGAFRGNGFPLFH